MDTDTNHSRQENTATRTDQNGHTQPLCPSVQTLEEKDPASRSREHNPPIRQGRDITKKDHITLQKLSYRYKGF